MGTADADGPEVNGNGVNGHGVNGNGNGANGNGAGRVAYPRRTIEMTGPTPPPRPNAAAERAGHVPNPNVGLGFLIVSNPDANLRRIGWLRWLAMGVRLLSRLLIAGIVVVVLPLVFAAASWLSNGQLPPAEFAWGIAVACLLTGAAWGTWALGHLIEQRRRELASIDGVDRNKPRLL